MAAYDDLNTKRIFIVGVLSIVVTAVTALAVQVVYYYLVSLHETDMAQKSSYHRQNEILEDQENQISQYGVDEETGFITIPISEAMHLIAAENGASNHQDDHAKENEADAKKHAEESKMKAAEKKADEKKSDEESKQDANDKDDKPDDA